MRQAQSSPTIFLLIGAATVLLVLCIAAGGFLLLPNLQGNAPASLPTVAILPSPTTTDLAPPTGEPTAAVVTRPTLPPTWTVTPTIQASPTAMITALALAPAADDGPPATALPPLNRQQLANTYWTGDGDGSMWDHQFEDGTFGRFAIQPVNVWVGAYGNVALTDVHEAGIQNALAQIAQVVPIQRVESRVFAHMTVWLMDDREFAEHAACGSIDMSIGCTVPIFTEAGIMLNTIWLRVTEDRFDTLLLHELTHGLGILVHSPDPQDIMYAYDEGQPARYTARDLDTLRALYNAPAFNPRAN